MGKVLSIITKPIRTFNIENRAHAVISQPKPTPAPSHKSTKRQREVAEKLNPTFLEEHYKKDQTLDERLKQVYVSSQTIVEGSLTSKSSNLPQQRFNTNENEHFTQEPSIIPTGRFTWGQVNKFLLDHANDPSACSGTVIARQYKLDEIVTNNILEHFKVVNVQMIEEAKVEPVQTMSYIQMLREVRKRTSTDLEYKTKMEELSKKEQETKEEEKKEEEKKSK